MVTKTTQMRRKSPSQGIALYGYTLIGHIESCGSKSLKIPRLQQVVRHIAEPGNKKNLIAYTCIWGSAHETDSIPLTEYFPFRALTLECWTHSRKRDASAFSRQTQRRAGRTSGAKRGAGPIASSRYPRGLEAGSARRSVKGLVDLIKELETQKV